MSPRRIQRKRTWRMPKINCLFAPACPFLENAMEQRTFRFSALPHMRRTCGLETTRWLHRTPSLAPPHDKKRTEQCLPTREAGGCAGRRYSLPEGLWQYRKQGPLQQEKTFGITRPPVEQIRRGCLCSVWVFGQTRASPGSHQWRRRTAPEGVTVWQRLFQDTFSNEHERTAINAPSPLRQLQLYKARGAQRIPVASCR